MKKLKALIITLVSLLAVFLAAEPLVLAASCTDCSNTAGLTAKQAIECGTNNASGSCGTGADATSNLDHTIKTVINLLSVAVGIVAVVMLIVGGFRYVTSSGNDTAIGAAKKTIMFALIGLVVVALAQVIAKFTLHEVSTSTTGSSSSGLGTRQPKSGP